jgi:hypothetical protein
LSAIALRAQRAVRAAERRPWLVVAAFVIVAAIARLLAARGNVAPWIFVDELLYGELAKNLADHLSLTIRDQHPYYSLLVPLLHAPGFLLGSAKAAYIWIKAVNALVMALAAVPAYGLARMAMSVRMSLLAAALTLAWPAYAYTGVIMTEPAFMTTLLLAVWMLARTLERPTRGRQAALMGATVLALLVRLQAVGLLVSIVIGCLAVAVLRREPGPWLAATWRALKPYWPILVFSIGLPILVVLFQLGRGAPIRSALGGYSGVDAGLLGFEASLRWIVRHIAVLTISVLVAPAAFAIGTLVRQLRRPGPPSGNAMVIAVSAFAVPLVLQVALFASAYSGRVEERNLFELEPLLVIAALAGISVLGYSRVATLISAALLTVAAISLPVYRLLSPPPLSDTFSLVIVDRLGDQLGLSPRAIIVAIALLGMTLTVALVLVRARPAVIAAGLAAGLLVAMSAASAEITKPIHDLSRSTATATIGTPFDWIDRAVGRNADATFVLPNDADPKLLWQAELWNRAVGPVLNVGGIVPPLPGRLVSFDPANGRFDTPEGTPLRAPYAIAPASLRLQGSPVTEKAGLILWRTAGAPLGVSSVTTGTYTDGWTGPALESRVYACRGGTFVLPIAVGFGDAQTLTISASGEPVRRVRILPGRTHALRIHTRPNRTTGACLMRVAVSPTATGDQIAGNGDARVLGARVIPPSFLGSG